MLKKYLIIIFSLYSFQTHAEFENYISFGFGANDDISSLFGSEHEIQSADNIYIVPTRKLNPFFSVRYDLMAPIHPEKLFKNLNNNPILHYYLGLQAGIQSNFGHTTLYALSAPLIPISVTATTKNIFVSVPLFTTLTFELPRSKLSISAKLGLALKFTNVNLSLPVIGIIAFDGAEDYQSILTIYGTDIKYSFTDNLHVITSFTKSKNSGDLNSSSNLVSSLLRPTEMWQMSVLLRYAI